MSSINNDPLDSQNFWELASIQVASVGILGVIFGWQLKNQFGIGDSIVAIGIGNLIQWLIGLVIIKMSSSNHIDAIENVKKYLGKGSAIGAMLTLIIACLFWFVYQLDAGIQGINHIFPTDNGIRDNVLWGTALGLCASFLGVNGIRLIKRMNVILFPVLIVSQIYALQFYHIETPISWGFSLTALGFVVLLTLVGTINLPTFFRHSRSMADSVLALTVIFFFNIFTQLSSVFIDFDQIISFFLNSNIALRVLLTLFVVFLVINNLLRNIYFASACWRSPTLQSLRFSNEYAIIGIAGTFAFFFIPATPPVIFVKDLITDFIANLGLVLLITFMVRVIIRRKPQTFGMMVGSASWLIGCIAATILSLQNPGQTIPNLFISLGLTALFYLMVIYIEIAIWSIKKLMNMKHSIASDDQ
ncbi:MAG: hypothetical protein HW387_709 [Parachlamydiales bacterium]|nr:hypothetical protein [Parachlamydiales bacterium]